MLNKESLQYMTNTYECAAMCSKHGVHDNYISVDLVQWYIDVCILCVGMQCVYTCTCLI